MTQPLCLRRPGALVLSFLLASAAPSIGLAQAPVIDAVRPTSAENPTPITIAGANFDATSQVSFAGAPATVLAQTPTLLTVQPPVSDPGFLDTTVTNAVGSTTAEGAARFWPTVSAVEGGLGGTVDVELANGEPGAYVLAFALQVLPAPVSIDPSVHYGVLLDASGTFGLLTAGTFPSANPVQVSLPIGVDPSVLGVTVYLQAFAEQGAPVPHDLSFTNAASVLIGASVPPSALSYADDPAVYTAGLPIAPNVPSVTGYVENWSVAPALPAGLALDAATGVIAGTPASTTATAGYTITAANPAGSTAATISITVLPQPGRMEIDLASNGFGQLLPHQILDFTGAAVDIRSFDTLLQNVSPSNPVLPVTQWPTGALLPDGTPGNHFVYVRFTEPIDVDSVLDSSLGAAAIDHLTGAIVVVAVDPVTGATTPVRGQPLIDGKTYDSTVSGGAFVLETWVVADPNDLDGDGILVEPQPVGAGTPGLGFPGTEFPSFAGALDLVSPDTFVYVMDSDALLTTHEAFPSGVQLRVEIGTGVLSQSGQPLVEAGVAAGTVGPDALPPEVRVAVGPLITPGGGDVDVDPASNVQIQFTEPIQILTVGPVPNGTTPTLSPSVALEIGSQAVSVPFTVLPVSPYDFTRLELDPVFDFPGTGAAPPGPLQMVDVTVNAGQLQDLVGNPNLLGATTSFVTGAGQGVVNAPIAPDTIYVGRAGSTPSVGVVDLHGFGASTGDPTFDPLCPIINGNTNYPNNPNVLLQGALMVPPLSPGTTTLDGGSRGVFTLARDTNLDDRLLRNKVASIDDMALGHSLDGAFNNSTFTCASAGGSICASTALKLFEPVLGGPNTLAPAPPGVTPLFSVFADENPISWAPHPNPPPVKLPVLCGSPAIFGQEPSSVDTPVSNLLLPGPFTLGNPALCIPPSTLLSLEQNVFFQGPSLPAALPACSPYAFRQQIGHFLYVVDKTAGELVVVNSNNFHVLDRIALPDPTRLAMAPNLDFVAVTNQADDSVSFIDVDPDSSTFHQVVQTTPVGDAPFGIAWETGNEDVLVCNEGDGSISVIATATLNVRKTLTFMLDDPFDVVTTPRQMGFGLNRGVYYAWILNRNGKLSLFESGPDGVNGWGYDDVIGQTPFTMANPTAIQADPLNVVGAVWVTHENQLDPTGAPTGLTGGAATNVFLSAQIMSIVPLDPGMPTPNLRDLSFNIAASIGSDVLTGVPSDLAFDNQRNFGSLVNFTTSFSAGFPIPMNGKSLVKTIPGTTTVENVSEPQYLFLAIPASFAGPGVVDVVDLSSFLRVDTDPFQAGVQSIPAEGATVLMDYFSQ